MLPSRIVCVLHNRLAKRFYTPASGRGPCPPPSFTPNEEFFADFITIADRYVHVYTYMLLGITDNRLVLLSAVTSSIIT